MSKKQQPQAKQPSNKIQIHTILEPKTEGQAYYLNALNKADVVICDGMQGTGKTYMAIGWAMQAIRSGLYERLIISRPAVDAGESIGFQPGDVHEKMAGYMEPIYDAIRQFCVSDQEYLDAINPKTGYVIMRPLCFMRGLNFRNAIAVLDEAQNASESQIRLFWGRACKGTKVIITGSTNQCDLPGGPVGFDKACDRLSQYDFRRGRVDFVGLGMRDIVRNDLIAELEMAMSE